MNEVLLGKIIQTIGVLIVFLCLLLMIFMDSIFVRVVIAVLVGVLTVAFFGGFIWKIWL